uniref:Uncharacterized protein n=1 Tax=Arundo donax TaxID=35708 RepID=A0A0A9CRT8_ARUDO
MLHHGARSLSGSSTKRGCVRRNSSSTEVGKTMTAALTMLRLKLQHTYPCSALAPANSGWQLAYPPHTLIIVTIFGKLGALQSGDGPINHSRSSTRS